MRVSSHWLEEIIVSMVIHFGKNPVRGGSPPKESRASISSKVEVKGDWDSEENCFDDFFIIVAMIIMIGVMIRM